MSTRPATAYRDLTKANDLLGRGFPSGGLFSLTTETKAGDATVKSTVKASSRDPVTATLEPKYEWKAQNLVFETSFSTANSLFAKATAKDLGTKGLNVSIRGDRKVVVSEESVSENFATATVQFNNQHLHLLTEAKVVSAADVAVSAAVHGVPHENVGVGLKVDYSTKAGADGKTAPVAIEGKLVGRVEQIEGALAFSSKQVVGVHFWHQACKDFQWATTISYPLAEDSKDVPTVNVGANYKLDDFTTAKVKLTAILNNKPDTKQVFRSGVSTQQKINANTTVTVGADVNLNNVFGTEAGGPTSCGFELSFK